MTLRKPRKEAEEKELLLASQSNKVRIRKPSNTAVISPQE
jgi:hypothetical protein